MAPTSSPVTPVSSRQDGADPVCPSSSVAKVVNRLSHAFFFSQDGTTALHAAAAGGHLLCVYLLCFRDANKAALDAVRAAGRANLLFAVETSPEAGPPTSFLRCLSPILFQAPLFFPFIDTPRVPQQGRTPADVAKTDAIHSLLTFSPFHRTDNEVWAAGERAPRTRGSPTCVWEHPQRERTSSVLQFQSAMAVL